MDIFGRGGLLDLQNPLTYAGFIPFAGPAIRGASLLAKGIKPAFDTAKIGTKNLFAQSVPTTLTGKYGTTQTFNTLGKSGPLYDLGQFPLSQGISLAAKNPLKTAALGGVFAPRLFDGQAGPESQANLLNVLDASQQDVSDLNINLNPKVPQENPYNLMPKQPNYFNDKFNLINKTSKVISPENISPDTQQESQQKIDAAKLSNRNQQIANMLFALSDVLRGKDPVPGAIQRKQMFDEEDRERRVKEFVEENAELYPGLDKAYQIGGAPVAIQYWANNVEAQKAIQQNQIKKQGLIENGLDESTASLIVDFDFTFEQAQSMKNMSGENLNTQLNNAKEIASTFSDVELSGLSMLDEAFGGGDAIENAFLSVIDPFISFETDTVAAVAAKDAFNQKLRTIYLLDYPGRPSVYTQERIDEIMPRSSFNSHYKAYQKYGNIQGDLTRMRDDVLNRIKSGEYNAKDTQNLIETYTKVESMLNKLEIAMDSLKGYKPDYSLDEKDFSNLDDDSLNQARKTFN